MSRAMTLAAVMEASGVKFGTSGARGLVGAMTDEVCYAFVTAFLQTLAERGELPPGTTVGIGGDRRASTGRIMTAAVRACLDHGQTPLDCGRVPSPALALLGLERHVPTIMVTGSHIPDDRNGIKFNTAMGEILKRDELAIVGQTVMLPDHFDEQGMLRPAAVPADLPVVADAERVYVERWLRAFPKGLLRGRRIGVYGHSAVGREILCEVLAALGAEVVRLGFSESFIPVDTEAIRPEDVELARRWPAEHGLFALASTDGDADRPLIGDERGVWMRGDVAGILCARYVGAEVVVTPVSCNTAVEKCGWFERVVRTRIGSPFVIEAMLGAVEGGARVVVGYEANGGFLTATPIALKHGRLAALPTRDPMVVILSILAMAVESDSTVSALLAGLPRRYTASDRLKQFPVAGSGALVEALGSGGSARLESALADAFGRTTEVDLTDGVRMTFASGEIVHVRPSGNAPELRCYAEADSEGRAGQLAARMLGLAAEWRERVPGD